jgi:hypothetical protein
MGCRTLPPPPVQISAKLPDSTTVRRAGHHANGRFQTAKPDYVSKRRLTNNP